MNQKASDRPNDRPRGRQAACRRSSPFAALAAPLLLVGGCTTANAPPPIAQVTTPLAWAETDLPPVSADIAQYWRLLDDPLLTSLVEQAIAANRDLAVSAARLDQSRASLRQARAGFLPSVSGNTRTSRDIGDFARDGVQFSAGVDVSWEADLFGQLSGNATAAQADLAAAGYSLADLQRLIVGQVALSTINARSLGAQLANARSSLSVAEDNLQIARWRNQAGLVSSLDVEQARAQRAQTAASIPQLESSLAATANALSTLVGETPGRVLTALQSPTAQDRAAQQIPRPPELAGFDAPAEVLRRRPDVRGAEASLIAASARIGVARAQLLPLVRLSGNLTTGQATIGNLLQQITGGLIASAAQMIFDGGRTRAQIDSAEAAARGSLAAWEQTILGALEEVESAAVERRTAAQRVRLNTEAVDAASTSAILARSQYQAGLTDFRTLLTAESQLLSSRNQLIGAEADRAAAFVRLTQALGGGWSAADFEFPLPTSDRTMP